jgi:membrane-associated protease RseP (regulator of RpoE activity)
MASRRPVLLFVATTFCVFLAGAWPLYPQDQPFSIAGLLVNLHRGWPFAVPLMAILLTHEFGHYFAARLHGVPASLPYFIPIPPVVPTPFGPIMISPFGTMGAVISMPERIRSKNALLDIGAAGPWAGMVVAVPVILIGLAQSPVQVAPLGALQEGNCLLYMALKYLVHGPMPAGHDVMLSPTAFAGWAGLLVTSLNLMPIGQLDGGHIAYALFGARQDRVARLLHVGLLAAFAYNFLRFDSAAPGMVWLIWFVLLSVFHGLSGGNHPPTDPEEKLTPGRRAFAMLSLLLFIVLFMPTPMREAEPPPLTPTIGPMIDRL